MKIKYKRYKFLTLVIKQSNKQYLKICYQFWYKIILTEFNKILRFSIILYREFMFKCLHIQYRMTTIR
jgi:hypothetical protein